VGITAGSREVPGRNACDRRHTYCIIIIIIIINTSRSKVTILWNQQIQTDRTSPSNKPDIIIRDNEKGACMLIDVAISADRNVIKKKPRRF